MIGSSFFNYQYGKRQTFFNFGGITDQKGKLKFLKNCKILCGLWRYDEFHSFPMCSQFVQVIGLNYNENNRDIDIERWYQLTAALSHTYALPFISVLLLCLLPFSAILYTVLYWFATAQSTMSYFIIVKNCYIYCVNYFSRIVF